MKRDLPLGIVVAFFVLWTLIATYPRAPAAADHIDNWGDPLLNVWIPAWDLHQLGRDPLHLFDAPIFYPAHDTLALSEVLLAQALQALPVVLVTGNFILAYNLIILLSSVLCGLGTYLLTREALPPGPSLVAGAAYAYSFFRVGEVSHIQILSGQWIPFALLALLRLWRGERWRAALSLTACLCLQLLSSFYLGLFLLVALAFALIFLAVADRRLPRPPFVLRLLVAAAIAAIVVLPFSLPYFRVEREFGLTRTLDDAIGGAATPRSYLTVPPTSLLYGTWHGPVLQQFQTDETLFPGVVPLALGLIGVATATRGRWRAFFLGLTLVGLVFSLGPRLRFGDLGVPLPYYLLYAFVPGFHAIRVVGRMGVVTTLGIAGLAGLGAAAILARLPVGARPVAGLLLAVIVGAETLSIPVRMTPVETPSEVPPVYRWLAAQPDNAPALELPTIQARWLDRASELERQGHELYLAIYHWHPTPSGYSGFEPPRFWSLIREAKDFPSDESINFLQCTGVRYVIFHQDEYAPEVWTQVAARLGASASPLRRLAQFGSDSVYALAAPPIADAPVPPRVVLPSAARAGESFRGFLDWPNPGVAVRLARPASISVEAMWRGPSQAGETTTLAEPTCLEQGNTTVPFDVAAPATPGTYDLSVTAAGVTTHQSIDVMAEPPSSQVARESPALQLATAHLGTATVPPGETVFVDATWRLRRATGDNYLLRLEVADGAGNVVASGTIDPFEGELETSRWLPGEVVALSQSAIVPRATPPGTYDVRLRVRFADGAEWILAGPDGNDAASVTVGQVRIG